MIPTAVAEMSHVEMQALHNATGVEIPDGSVLARRVLIRTAEGAWLTGRDRRSTTTDRQGAFVFDSYGNSLHPDAAGEGCIIEILPDEDAPERVMPPSEWEHTEHEMNGIFGKSFTERDDHERELMVRPVIIRIREGNWMKTYNPQSLTTNRNRSLVFRDFGATPGDGVEPDAIIEVLPEVARTIPEVEEVAIKPEVIDPPKVNLVNKLFSADFIGMLKAAPKNEMVRGWILKVTKQLPPEDCDTIDKLEAWLQSIQKEAGVPLKAPGKRAGMRIDIDFTGEENGRVRYSVQTSGSDTFAFDDDELREMVEENADDWDGLVSALKDLINSEIWDRTEPSMEAGDNEYDYTGYDSSGDGDTEWDFSLGELKDRLKEWLRANMPEEARTLDMD